MTKSRTILTPMLGAGVNSFLLTLVFFSFIKALTSLGTTGIDRITIVENDQNKIKELEDYIREISKN